MKTSPLSGAEQPSVVTGQFKFLASSPECDERSTTVQGIVSTEKLVCVTDNDA